MFKATIIRRGSSYGRATRGRGARVGRGLDSLLILSTCQRDIYGKYGSVFVFDLHPSPAEAVLFPCLHSTPGIPADTTYDIHSFLGIYFSIFSARTRSPQ